MRKRILQIIVSFTLVLLSGLQVSAMAAVPVTGVIITGDGDPVIGATVIVKGTQIGVVADLDGQFRIEAPSVGSVLVFSSVGYVTQEITVSSVTMLNVIMDEEELGLEEVVVVAYGSQKKATLTGAIASVGTSELTNTPVSDVTNVLAGKMPGVTTVQTTGQPGADNAQIYIRGVGSLSSGSSQPLVLVDGIERSFSDIDANEIETLTVLKDASSTAVFGVRGANGVILVTTRRGATGKAKIDVSTTFGVQQPMSFVQQTDSYDYAMFWNQKQENDGVTDESAYFSKEAIRAYKTNSDPLMYANSDWADILFNDVFFQTQSNINISGGSEDVQYFVSLGMLYKNGVLKQMEGLDYDNNYKYNRYNFRTNLDFKLSPTTKMKFNVGSSIGKSQEPQAVEDISYGWVAANIWTIPMAGPGLVDGVRTLSSTNLVPDGLVGGMFRDGYFIFYGYGYKQDYTVALNMDTEIIQDLSSLTKGLEFSVKGAYDNNFRLDKDRTRLNSGIESQYVYYASDLEYGGLMAQTDPDYDKTYVFVPSGTNEPLSYSETSDRDRNWYIEGKLAYNRNFDDHAVSALALYTQSRNYYPVYSSGSDMPYQYIPRSYSGVVGRVTYGYKSKYLAEFNVGYNGSENFASGKNRYGLFPAVSAGYVISEEKFMKQQNTIGYLKLRASVGKVGNDTGADSRFMYMDGVWTQSGSYYFGQTSTTGTPTYTLGTSGNEDVTWETSTKFNTGIDATLLKDRLSISADYFYEQRVDILTTPNSLPSLIVISSPDLNIGEVQNQGYELSIGWAETTRGGWRYDINANVSFARNKIIYMDEVAPDYDYQAYTGGSVGRNDLMYECIGIYQQSDFVDNGGVLTLRSDLPQPYTTVYPGDAMYADLNGDNIVDSNDKQVTGFSSVPEYIFGLNGLVEYKGFQFTMQWMGAANVDKLLGVEYRIPFTNAGNRGLLEYFVEDCWSPTNTSGTLPRASETSETWNSDDSSLWLHDASYLRLKTVSIGYTFKNQKFLKNLGIKSMGVKISGYNLLTFSGMTIMDPETVASNYGQYPLVKTYDLGLSVNF